jgi:hypothetical protein
MPLVNLLKCVVVSNCSQSKTFKPIASDGDAAARAVDG